MSTPPNALSGITNFYAVGHRFGTAGQPTEGQFRAVREAGYDAVINLALPTSDNPRLVMIIDAAHRHLSFTLDSKTQMPLLNSRVLTAHAVIPVRRTLLIARFMHGLNPANPFK